MASGAKEHTVGAGTMCAPSVSARCRPDPPSPFLDDRSLRKGLQGLVEGSPPPADSPRSPALTRSATGNRNRETPPFADISDPLSASPRTPAAPSASAVTVRNRASNRAKPALTSCVTASEDIGLWQRFRDASSPGAKPPFSAGHAEARGSVTPFTGSAAITPSPVWVTSIRLRAY